MTADEDIVSVEDAAVLLKIGRTTAYALARRGELPGAIKLGGRWRVSLPKLRRIVHGSEPGQS